MRAIMLWLLGAFECSTCGLITTKVGTFSKLKQGKPPENRHVCLRCFADQRRRDISQKL